MITGSYKRRLHISLALVGLVWAAAMACMFSGVAQAATLSHIAPDPSSSTPTASGHVFFVRKAKEAGKNEVASIDAYYDKATFEGPTGSTAWSNQHIEINPGGPINAGPDARVCNVYDQGANKAQFMKVAIEAEGRTVQNYFIPSDRVCVQKNAYNSTGTNANNALFAKYPMPTRPADVNGPTQMYKVSITITYHDSAQDGTANNPQGVRFTVVSNPSTKVKIGPTGGGSYEFPIIGAYNPDINGLWEQQISIPFGQCFGGGNGRLVGVRDSDNWHMPNTYFEDRKVRFKVWDATDKVYVPYTYNDGNNNGHETVNGWFQANDDLASDTQAYFRINMKDKHKYEMRVIGIAPRNTIVLSLPGNVIAGDEEVCNADWVMQGTSSPTREVSPGEEVIFTHTLKNTGKSTSDSVSSGVYWGPTGYITVTQPIPNGNTARTYAAGESQQWTNKFKIPDDAPNNRQYCQIIKWRPKIKDDPSPATYGSSSPACVTVIRPSDSYVTLEAFVDNGIDTETLTTTQIHGRVNVSGFPSISNRSTADGQWGYSEISQQVAATNPPSVWYSEGYVGPPQYMYDYVCPGGWTPASSPTPTTCYGPAPIIGYSCPAGYTPSGGTCYVTFSPWPAPLGCGTATLIGGLCYVYYSPNPIYGPQPTQAASLRTNYSYYCRQTGTYGAWTTSSTDYCADYYKCPANGGEGWATSSSGLICTSWVCAYSTGPFDANVYPPANKPKCEYRCPTSGERAWFDKGYADTTGSGDRRCFVQPSFVLTCQWDTGEVTTETVNSNGTYCSAATTTRSAGAIGTVVQATLTPLRPSGWLPSNPQPGMIFNRFTNSVQQLKTWGWIMIPKTATNKVVGMPYVKVYGGDVRVGGGVGATSQTCNFSTASIKTYNQGSSGGYAGSGTQLAAYSTGFISSFISGQYNDMSASPNVGTPPTRLTFANNAGGSGWGGGFGNSGPCYNYVERLPDDAQHITGSPTVISGQGIGIGQKTVQHVKGDVYITGDIRYANGNWTTSVKIPLYQLVVEGNIYIDDDVHQLDGVYAAIPTNGSNGNIYTCAFVQNGNPATVSVPTDTFLQNASDNCKSQLVVNGSVAARKIFFARDCGSVIMSYSTEATASGFQGGTDVQYCGGQNHAAEVFNYTPEAWIRSSTGTGSNKYDSIVSLPPVL